MRRVPFLLYPGLQPAAPYPAAVDVASFQFNAFLLQVPNQAVPVVVTFPDSYWAEWRVPVRYPRDPRYSTAFAAGETPWPYNQPAADNANTNWYQALSLPQRFPRDPRYRATLDASGEPKWPYNQPASDNANTRWFQPLSEPRREYRFAARITGETPWPAVAGNPTGVFPDGWFAEWRLPQRALRNPRYGAAFAAGETPWPYNQPAADNATTRWHSPLSEPRREYRWIARVAGETSWPFDSVFQTPSLVWWRPFSEPQRFKRDPRFWAALTATGEAPWSRIQPNPISMAWWRALEEPRRFLRNPKAATTLAASGLAPWGVFTPPPPPDLQLWWLSPLSEPKRFLRDLRYSAVLAASGQAPFAGLPVSAPLGATRRALLRSGAFPTFWPGAS